MASEGIDFRRLTAAYKRQLEYLQGQDWGRRIGNRSTIRRLRVKIKAIQEAQRDVTNTAVLGRVGVGNVIKKNAYPTYADQVDACYRMYDGLTDYGGEILSSVADIRIAFIAGEGISFYSKNKAKTKFVKAFLKRNKLNGSKLLAAVRMGELEGKVLFVLAENSGEKATEEKGDGNGKTSGKGNIDARLFSWHTNKYTVERDKQDYEKITKIAYKPDGADKEKEIDVSKSLYVKLGGCDYKGDSTPTKLGKVLTQCENASRAAYDLRVNTHLFGRIFPYWETTDGLGAKQIIDGLADKSFELGDGYAGTAKMSLLEPGGQAADAVIKDMLNALRFVAAMTGVPIHWLAWPELMSNRATAENMLEVVSAATKNERLIWQEALSDMLEKVMRMAVDAGFADSDILEGEFDLRLPLISLAALQQLVDVWLPMREGKAISMFTLRNMIPGIDPIEEERMVDEEEEKAAEKSPMNNVTGEELLDEVQLKAQQEAAARGEVLPAIARPGAAPTPPKPGSQAKKGFDNTRKV